MIEKQIVSNLILLTFPPNPDDHYGVNVYLIHDGQKALMIDTGYENQCQQVIDYLNQQNLELDTVIISHFHDDHMEGLKLLKPKEVIGSAGYLDTLNKWTSKDDHAFYKPTKCISEETRLEFAGFQLKLIPMNGHSESGLFIVINEQFMHIGDEIIQDNNGKPILPAVEKALLASHIESLEYLESSVRYHFLLSHGPAIDFRYDRTVEVTNRLKYLRKVFQSEVPLSYEEAAADCDSNFLHPEWHQNLYE